MVKVILFGSLLLFGTAIFQRIQNRIRQTVEQNGARASLYNLSWVENGFGIEGSTNKWASYTKPALPNITLTATSASSTVNLKWSFSEKGVLEYKVFQANPTTGPFTPTIIQNKNRMLLFQLLKKTL